jgi:hypothetical protein
MKTSGFQIAIREADLIIVFWVSSRLPVAVAEFFRLFLHSLQTNAGIVAYALKEANRRNKRTTDANEEPYRPRVRFTYVGAPGQSKCGGPY